MATGAVADFGANDSSISPRTPRAAATPSAVTTATTDPATSAARIGSRLCRTRPRFARSGTASATVAGPSMKWTNCAPSK